VNYNGKVTALSGPLLDTVEDIVTGLPVSDHDHGINGLEFDDYGNMFIQVGGNTNAGVPGPLSQTYLQDENYLSAATLIARGVTRPNFDGLVTYDTNGDMTAGYDVQVYAAGMRNPFDVSICSTFHCHHSNIVSSSPPTLSARTARSPQ
jgi:glucose/arabinose dehydrogenase